MTKEAKVGMLTGLGVIVVIGVLLSEYLGTPPGGAPSSVATGKMAPLPIGAAKRTQLLEEVGVPAMVQAESTAVAGAPASGVPNIPAAFAADIHREAPLSVPAPTVFCAGAALAHGEAASERSTAAMAGAQMRTAI